MASESLSNLISTHASRHPAESAAAILRALGGLSGSEREVARFLLASDLAELGLHDLAAAELRSLGGSKELAPAAFVALARLRDEAGEAEALTAEARSAPWARIDDADFDETVFRVARAAFRSARYPECRGWLARIAPDSEYAPYARFLTAQSEYALGRTGHALEAATPIFHGERAPILQDRTAVLLGDILTEVGLYTDAVAVLSWPAAGSAFRRRAEKDMTIARTLAELESRDASIDTTAVERLADEHERRVAAAVDSPGALAARAADLRRAWPPPALVQGRRRWAAERAEEAQGRVQGFGVRRVLEILWQSLPTTILARLWQAERRPSPAAETRVAAETRFFFAPDPEAAKLLGALALFASSPAGDGCGALAARALRDEAAAAAVDRSAPASLAKLDRLARGCGGERPGVEAALAAALEQAIAADALEIRRRARAERLRLAAAIADLRYAASRPAPEAQQ